MLMSAVTSRSTAPRVDARKAVTTLPLCSAPCTTVSAGCVSSPKIPMYVGDSWRPAAAGAVPLAVVSAALAGRVTDPKIPTYVGD
jgi:hypothetical protein